MKIWPIKFRGRDVMAVFFDKTVGLFVWNTMYMKMVRLPMRRGCAPWP